MADTLGGGEGLDDQFRPDITLQHDETLQTDAGEITALHTPGHMGNHLCFAWNGLIFSGDLIMGWSSSLISPPDGDVAAFRDSCALLRARPNGKLMPGHGAPIADGHARIKELLEHRAIRETQILKQLKSASNIETAQNIQNITSAIYEDLDPLTLRAASRNTFAHLIDLTNRKIISAVPEISQNALFHTN